MFRNIHWHCLTDYPMFGGLVFLFGSCRIKLHSKVSRCFLKIVTIKLKKLTVLESIDMY